MPHTDAADKVAARDRCFADLRAFVLDAAAGSSFHDFEHGVWRALLRLGHAAVADFLRAHGTGDGGPDVPLPDGRRARRLPAAHARAFTCVFGTFTLDRARYGTRDGQKLDVVPLDARLQLPAAKFSYLLQDFNALLATDQPFGQVAAALERILGLTQYVDGLERQAEHMAGAVEAFRAAQPAPPAAAEGAIVVRSADAKGVPMRCPADAPPIRSHDHQRGPKTGRKKQAIVGAVYTVAPLVRTPDEVVALLFADAGAAAPRPRRPRPCHKRVIARLNEYTDAAGAAHDGMAEVFTWMAGDVRARNPAGAHVVVNLFDGDERLASARAAAVVPGRQVNILDLLHVTPKLWDAAAVFARRDSAAAQAQVRAWVRDVLKGRAKRVIAAIRDKAQAARLTAAQQKEVTRVTNFLDKRRGQLRYHVYLKNGYPIASGVIEGACRHYVKDRMERTGMSWKQRGAQAMLGLRSVALNGDWDDFQTFYRAHECEVLYPHRHLLEEVGWPVAV